MKRNLRLLVFLWTAVSLLFLLPGGAALAEDIRVYDQAALFSEDEAALLESRLAGVSEDIKMELVVVTTEDAEGKSAMEYADDFYDQNGFGTGNDYSGALFLIDMDNREIYISTAGKMIDILSDARIETLLDDAFDGVSNQRYADAAESFIDGVVGYVDRGVEPGQYRYDTETGEVTPYRSLSPLKILVAVAGSFVVALICCIEVVWRYQMRTPAYTYPFREKSHVTLSRREDQFLNQTVTRRHIPPPSSGSGGGRSGGSSVHTSSSGRSHGGGGRSF